MKKQPTKQLLINPPQRLKRMQTNLFNFKKITVWILLVGIFTLSSVSLSSAQSEADTVIIDFGDSSKVTVYIQNPKDAKAIRDLDWNLIMERTANYLEEAHQNTDETEEQGQGEENETNDPKESENKDSFEVGGKNKTRTIIIGTGGIRIEKGDDNDPKEKTFWRRTRHEMPIYFGLNNYFQDGKFGETPTGKPYELRSWGSRYFAFGSSFKTQIGGKKSPLLLQYGLEASWNNFMFSGDNYALESQNGVTFPEFESPLEKSKLTAAYINVPLMIHLDFAKDDKMGLKVAFGGYAGYRVGSYTKIVYNENADRQKDKEHSNFRLNDWRYGVRAEIGLGEGKFDNGVRLFFNYDLNPLFTNTANLPKLNAFSFGVRI